MSKVLITGCNRGLGFALLEKFSSEGYDIVACSRKRNDTFCEKCHKLERQYGVSIQHLYFDMSNKQQVEYAAKEIDNIVDIDVMVNNAGINIMKPLLYVDYEEMLNSFSVNYFAPVLLTKSVISIMMRQGRGSIINVTSVGSLGHQPGGTCYDASKSALNQFTITLAQELAPFNVRVNAVACGPIKTEMFTTMSEKVQSKLVKSVAFKRPAEVSEVVDAIWFMATEKSSYVTGQIFRIDGGIII